MIEDHYHCNEIHTQYYNFLGKCILFYLDLVLKKYMFLVENSFSNVIEIWIVRKQILITFLVAILKAMMILR